MKPSRKKLKRLSSLAVPLLAFVLTWQDNSDNEEAFVVEIRIGGLGQPWQQEAIVPADVTSYPIQFYNTRRHCFQVRAYNQIGESNPSNIVCHMPKWGDL